jgi:hypothetical protein
MDIARGRGGRELVTMSGRELEVALGRSSRLP